MFDQMRSAYSQMQPGDKMVMQLHKSQKPPVPEYQTPGQSPSLATPGGPAGPAGGVTGGPRPDISALPGYGVPGVPGNPVPTVPIAGADAQSALIDAMRRRFHPQA